MNEKEASTPIDIRQVKITDPFWGTVQETVRREVLPYQWEALNDRVPGAEPSFCMHNFRAAARLMERKTQPGFTEPGYTFRGFQTLPEDKEHPEADKFYGFVFQDSDFYKWVEAAAYSLSNHPDPELEGTVDGAIEIICAAQHESGYLDTYYILNGMDGAFTNLKDHHELYCLGHLIESAVAYYQATGKDKLLRVACRYADYVCQCFGPEEGKCKGYPGHEIAEMALVRLYEATGQEKYLDLSRFFLDQRGTSPNYFLEEEKRRAQKEGRPVPKDDSSHYAYYQAHKPVREQEEAVGHAVRAGYLYSGMADMSRLTGDEELLAACKRLWDNIVKKKLYITGGIGGTAVGEAFSYPYDLPNDTAYSETCAAISLAFFARRMLEISPSSEYADVMELSMYNTVVAGMALDGKSFFYVNPLEVYPKKDREVEAFRHVKVERQKWFACACCPPNLARLAGSVGSYIYTQSEDRLLVNLYIGSEAKAFSGENQVRIRMETEYPWKGNVRLELTCGSDREWELGLHLPGWCRNFQVLTDGEEADYREREGYLYLKRCWKGTHEIRFEMEIKPRMVRANPKVRDNIGKTAVLRGPVVYCLEEEDNGPDLHCIQVTDKAVFKEEYRPDLLRGVVVLESVGRKQKTEEDRPLYSDSVEECYEEKKLTWIPYYAWANRGPGEMMVWVRR